MVLWENDQLWGGNSNALCQTTSRQPVIDYFPLTGHPVWCYSLLITFPSDVWICTCNHILEVTFRLLWKFDGSHKHTRQRCAPPGLGVNQTSVMFTFFPKFLLLYKNKRRAKKEMPLSNTELAFTVLEIFLVSLVSFTIRSQIMTRLMTGMHSLLFYQSLTFSTSWMQKQLRVRFNHVPQGHFIMQE